MYLNRTVKHRKIRYQNIANTLYAVGGNLETLVKKEWRLKVVLSDKNLSKLRTASFKNICFITGKARGITYRGLARHSFKFLALRGLILGLKKASW